MREILKKYSLSPNQYYFLMAMFDKTAPFKIHKDEINELKARNFMVEDDSGMYLSDVSERIFNTTQELEKLFNEVWDLYPERTPNGRRLRPLSSDSQIGKKAYHKLKSNLKNYNNFKKIITGLKSEINIKTRTGSLNYMKHINTWINQKSWEEYMSEDESEEGSSVFNLG